MPDIRYSQLEWRGVQPLGGINGIWPDRKSERINKEASQAGVGDSIVYTVPADKIFLLTVGGLSCYNSAGAGNNSGLGVRNVADVHQFYLLFHYFSAQSQHSGSRRFFPAIEVPAGYDVYVMSDNANVTAMGSAYGWLEDVPA